MTTGPIVPATAEAHVITEVQEGTINPRLRCTCGWQVTSYNYEQRVEEHLASVSRKARQARHG